MKKRGYAHIQEYQSKVEKFSHLTFPTLAGYANQEAEKSIELERIYELKAKYALTKGEAYSILLGALVDCEGEFHQFFVEELGLNLEVASDFFQKNYPTAEYSVRPLLLLEHFFDEIYRGFRLKPEVYRFIMEGISFGE